MEKDIKVLYEKYSALLNEGDYELEGLDDGLSWFTYGRSYERSELLAKIIGDLEEVLCGCDV